MSGICKLCGRLLASSLKPPVPNQRLLSSMVNRVTSSPTHRAHRSSCGISRATRDRRFQFSLSAPGRRSFTSSVSEEETQKFSKLASSWWDERGEMAPLHSMNTLRVPFIRDCLLYQGHGTPNCPRPLEGVDILDVGCGAGILSEPLARLGAAVVGVDSSEDALIAAKLHRADDPELKSLQYLDSWLEDIAAVGSIKFDCVVASEVVEHVTDYKMFLQLCSTVLKPGGSLIVSTINRTNLSYLLAILVAEHVMRIVAPGTHTWEQLITPDELETALLQADCSVRKLHGMCYEPFRNKWTWTGGTDLNYIVHAVKADSENSHDESEQNEAKHA